MAKVLITGTFDIIHPGHLKLIAQAKKLGDVLVILLARDVNVVKAKGRTPYFNEQQRLNNLQQLNLADKVILGDKYDPYKVLTEEAPDIVALGYDQKMFVDDLQNKISKKTKIVSLQPFKENICKSKNIRKALEDKSAGFLLINKPMDWTSHDVVAKLRSTTKIKQIGHAGTLDPFATGLLICAIGNATKMIDLFHLLPKVYEAEIKLGVTSDSYDRTGKVSQSAGNSVNQNEVEKVLLSFIGKQQQLPPMFSAKKVEGKKLYELARKGKEVKRQPAEIEIYNIELLDFNPQLSIINIKVSCSAGTYIRSLGHDIGQKLGSGAILNELKRTAIGQFYSDEAVFLEDLTSDNYLESLIKPTEVLQKINQLVQ